ncbi:MAG: hypothetical protein IKO76_02260 [Butyrivibrio sp.]|nr:hypothetical protein [Butyrivibrio sp.]
MKNCRRFSKVISCVAALAMVMAVVTTCKVTALADDSDVPFKEEAVVITGYPIALPQAATAYDAPSEDANVVHEFAAGDPIFKIGEDNGYIVINYKGESLYIKSDVFDAESMAAAEASNAAQAEEVSKELEQMQQNDQTYVDSYMRQVKSQRNALIWKIVIGVLVALFVAISVIIAVQNSKKGNSAARSAKTGDKTKAQ